MVSNLICWRNTMFGSNSFSETYQHVRDVIFAVRDCQSSFKLEVDRTYFSYLMSNQIRALGCRKAQLLTCNPYFHDDKM